MFRGFCYSLRRFLVEEGVGTSGFGASSFLKWTAILGDSSE